MKIKPIKTEREYERALKEIDKVMDAELGTPEGKLLEALSIAVEKYEDIHYPLDLDDPVDAIQSTMKKRRLSRRDLEPYIGSRARVAEVLNRRRRLTLPMIRRLHMGLGIPAEILIR